MPTCDGCGEELLPEDAAVLWFQSELGLSAVHVHKNADHVCVELARTARAWPPGTEVRHVVLGPTREDKLKTKEAKELDG